MEASEEERRELEKEAKKAMKAVEQLKEKLKALEDGTKPQGNSNDLGKDGAVMKNIKVFFILLVTIFHLSQKSLPILS